MKITLSILTLTIITFINSAVAQEKNHAHGPKIGVGAEVFTAQDDNGYGFSLNYQFPISHKASVISTVSYLTAHSTLKVYPGPKPNKYIPVKTGLRYFLSERFFVQGEVGAAFENTYDKKTRFLLAPGIGVELPVFNTSSIEFGCRYENYISSNPVNMLSLRVAYNLGF